MINIKAQNIKKASKCQIKNSNQSIQTNQWKNIQHSQKILKMTYQMNSMLMQIQIYKGRMI